MIQIAQELSEEQLMQSRIQRMRVWIFAFAALFVMSTLLFLAQYSLFRGVLRNEALRDIRHILSLSAQDKLEQVKSSGLASDYAVESMQELQQSYGDVESFKIVESDVGLPGLPIIVRVEVQRKGVVAHEFYVFDRAVICSSVSRGAF